MLIRIGRISRRRMPRLYWLPWVRLLRVMMKSGGARLVMMTRGAPIMTTRRRARMVRATTRVKMIR